MPCMTDSTFLRIENAAHGGAFGNNALPEPTEAQCSAGNYKVGRVNLYGLAIAIEQPRNSYRTGVDAKTGKRWVSRMAAHYGYINGTKGADGDGVDCFVGFYPQSRIAYVINQNVGGRFDEHKVCLCFPDEDSARRAYQDSYERGWDGLGSIVPASISQLKWWLRSGDTRRPLRAADLPQEGLEAMTRKVQWNSDALPYDATLDQVLYEIRRADAGEGLLMDAVSAQEIVEDADGMLTFDALVSPYAKLERKMELLRGIMERTGDKVKPVAMQITEPFKQRGVANVAAIFELSDGQTVSIYFHNPDVNPAKMAPADEVISWKWLLNKKDITIVVAPERGADLNVREVARRIMRLAEKNSPAFQRINGKRSERMQAIQSLKDEIAGLETELASAQHELEVAKVDAEDAQNQKNRAYAEAVQRANETGDAYIRASENGGIDPKTGKTKEELRALSDSQAAEAQRLKDIANGVTPTAETAENSEPPHAPVAGVADLTYRRDGLFTTFLPNTPAGEKAWGEIAAKTDGTGKVLAAHTEDTIRQLHEAGYTVAEDTSAPSAQEDDAALLAELGQKPDEQDATNEQALIDAYVKAWGEEAEKINAAVAAINWAGITDTASANAEMQKLHDSANSDRPIIKARDAMEAAGIKTWDSRLAGLSDTPEFQANGKATEAYRAAMDKMQALAKEKLIAAGKAELAELPADAPLNDVARAVFHKHGIDIGQRGDDWIARVVQCIEAKDADGLRSILAGVGSDSNKASMEIFERATGVKLAKTQRERGRQIDEWAGITPEKRAEIEAAKDAAWLARERERNVKDAWGALKAMNVRDGGSGAITDGQQYLLGKFAAGYSEVGTSKKGAATIYGLRNGDSLSFVNSRNYNDFLKAAAAFGGLRQALELVGAVEPKAEGGDADKIAAVDAAYKFESASDEFKLWLAEFLGKEDYSPFMTAKAMDEEVKRQGAGVEWGEFAGAALDDAGAAVAALEQSLSAVETNEPINRAEGNIAQAQLEAETAASLREAIDTLTEADYAPSEEEIGGTFDADAMTMDSAPAGTYSGADKRAISATNALLKYFRDFIASDAKFAKVPTAVYGWTAEGQIMDKDEAKSRLRKLIDVAINRKAGIPDLTPKEDQRLADFAHDARTISDYLTKRIRHTGARNLLRTPEMKAKYPHIDNQPADGLDSVSLDGVDDDGYVGKVKKGGEVVGRIDIGDDGKAMVYVGAAGDQRVVFPSGVTAMYSDSDGPEMIDALLASPAASTEPATAQPEKMTGPAKDRMAALKVLTDTGMNRWMSESQNKAVIAGLMGEEWQFFADKMKELAGVIATMPKTYEQDGKGDEAVAYLHYFRGAGDWYITEKDMEGVGTEQAFGLANLGYGGELGYISIAELVGAGVELDFHFAPKTLAQVKGRPAGAEGTDGGQAESQPTVEAGAAPQADPQKDADRALFQSVIDGTVPDILAPELADDLEAAYIRNQGDPELAALFEKAVAAYQSAMMTATSSLA